MTSGFLLYLPFAASHLRGAPGVGLRGYAIRRVARIYPAYWFVLLFFTFVAPRINIYGLHGFLLHTSLTQTYVHINPFVDGLPPAWSLVVEISFYVFLPVYAAVIGARARRSRPLSVELTGLAVLFAIGLIAIVAIAFGLDMPWVTVLPQHLGAFALGMLLAVLISQPWDDDTAARLARIGRPAWIWWTGALLALVAIPVVFRLDPLAEPSAVQAIGLNVCQMIVGICIVVPVVLGPQDHGAIRRAAPLDARGVPRPRQLRDLPVALVHPADRRGLAGLARSTTATGSSCSRWRCRSWSSPRALSWFALERPVLRLAHRVGRPVERSEHAYRRDYA